MSIVVPIPPALAVRISTLNQLGRIELGRIDVPAQIYIVDVFYLSARVDDILVIVDRRLTISSSLINEHVGGRRSGRLTLGVLLNRRIVDSRRRCFLSLSSYRRYPRQSSACAQRDWVWTRNHSAMDVVADVPRLGLSAQLRSTMSSSTSMWV